MLSCIPRSTACSATRCNVQRLRPSGACAGQGDYLRFRFPVCLDETRRFPLFPFQRRLQASCHKAFAQRSHRTLTDTLGCSYPLTAAVFMGLNLIQCMLYLSVAYPLACAFPFVNQFLPGLPFFPRQRYSVFDIRFDHVPLLLVLFGEILSLYKSF